MEVIGHLHSHQLDSRKCLTGRVTCQNIFSNPPRAEGVGPQGRALPNRETRYEAQPPCASRTERAAFTRMRVIPVRNGGLTAELGLGGGSKASSDAILTRRRSRANSPEKE